MNADPFSPDYGEPTSWNPGTDREVYDLALSGEILYACGAFETIGGGKERSYIAALDAATGQPTGFSPYFNRPVAAIEISGDILYVGGWFTNVQGYTYNRLAALNADPSSPDYGEPTSWNPNAEGTVEELLVDRTTLYAAGGFEAIGGQPRYHLAGVSTETGAATGFDAALETNGWVNAMALSGDKLYVGGSFDYLGGQRRMNLAAVDKATGAVATWTCHAGNNVYALAVYGGELYAGGEFASLGGEPREHIACLVADPDSPDYGKATSWDPGADGPMGAFALSGTTIYAGGSFTDIGGAERHYLAAVDITTGSATSWDPLVNSYVHSLACTGSTLYVGGRFDRVNGEARSGLARFDTPVPPTVTYVDPSLGINEAGATITVLGTGFKEGAAVRLRKAGEDDIEATNITVLDATTITCDLDLNGVPVGSWDVVVINPDGQEGVLGGGFTVYQKPLSDEFGDSALNPRWVWLDPLSDCGYDLAGNPGYLRISVAGNDHDLHPANNLNAPRVLQPIYEDFSAETRVLVDPQHDACEAGILAWKDQENFLCLERGIGYNDQVISFWGVVGGVETPYASVGSTSTEAYVRLSRVGDDFSAYYSLDGVNWSQLATCSMAVDEPVQVGLHAVNQHNDYPFQADFDYFRCGRYFVRAMVVGGQGTVEAETQVVERGGDADVFITPDAGRHIAGITDNGNPVTVADPSRMNYTLENVTENHLVEVTFELNTLRRHLLR
ncbi:DUF1349 domain-containing protein, partial [Candidatus Solincola tengchongensis]|uniref:beta-xylosidase family glycoside hydrolase n=1 Tax=Candidatus Solincola tengchongensis TaxID=2900693 RepID=UPI00257CE0E2